MNQSSDSTVQWWYCLKHQAVEQTDACANSERMGPYASYAEAEAALTTAAERSEQWDNDPRWNDE